MRPRRRQATPLFFAVVLITAFVAVVYASTTLQTNFNNAYPLSDYPNSAPLHNNCSVCHPGYNTNSFNSYATDLRSAGGNFRAIENDDSDNDGFSNIAEITAGTFPGDGSSHPVLDTTAPLITINSPTTSSTYSTDVSSISLAGTATDGVGVVLVGWSNSGGGSGTCSGTTSWNCSGINLSSGENVITVTALDAADNAGADMLTVTYTPADNTAPAVTINSPTTSSTYSTDVSSISLAGTAMDGVGVVSVGWSNSGGGNGTCSGTTSWSCSGINLSSGENVITVTALDAADNAGTDMLTVTYTPTDNTAPAVTINSPTTSSTYSTDLSSISLAGTATDGVGVVLVGWSNSGGGSGSCSGTTNWNCSGINLSSGENVITVTALDAADNAGADMLTVTCTPTDNAAPEITSFSIPSTSTSMTVPITSLTATDDVYVSGFILTESPAAPDPNAEGWSATAPASYTFSPVNVSTSGYQAEANMTKVLYAWAKDAAGNVSAGASASTVIELPPVDLSEMAAWEGKWFRVVISGLDQSATVGYLKIQSWNFNPPILQSELFMREIGEKGGKGKKKEEGGVDTWNSSVLNLLYTSGDPLRFFFSFDYLNLFGFSGGIDGKLDRNGMLARATVTMAGVYLPGTEDTEFGEYEGHDGSDEDDDVNNPGDLVTIRGRLTSEWLVPMEVLATEGTEPNAQTENERLLYRSRSKELRPGSSPREKHGEGDSL
jgi:hypothetical protein